MNYIHDVTYNLRDKQDLPVRWSLSRIIIDVMNIHGFNRPPLICPYPFFSRHLVDFDFYLKLLRTIHAVVQYYIDSTIIYAA